MKKTLETVAAVSPTGFHDRDGQQYCQQCFLTLFASRCQGCSQPILENYISALNSLWHPQCFVCRVSIFLDTVSGQRANKEQVKKPFVCMQQVLFGFERSALVRGLEDASQVAFKGEEHLIYILFASNISQSGKTHLIAGLISAKGILKGIICLLCGHVTCRRSA